jgi:hypothetical protein
MGMKLVGAPLADQRVEPLGKRPHLAPFAKRRRPRRRRPVSGRSRCRRSARDRCPAQCGGRRSGTRPPTPSPAAPLRSLASGRYSRCVAAGYGRARAGCAWLALLAQQT